jgi:hypothetical protein
MFDLYRQYRHEGRNHDCALAEVCHSYGQGANLDEELPRFAERLAAVAAEFDDNGGD